MTLCVHITTYLSLEFKEPLEPVSLGPGLWRERVLTRVGVQGHAINGIETVDVLIQLHVNHLQMTTTTTTRNAVKCTHSMGL